MPEALVAGAWPWWIAGPAIGLVVTLLAWVTGKALGVSTGYGVICAVGSRLAYFRALEFGEAWRLWFIAGLPLGGLVASLAGGDFSPGLTFGTLDVLTRDSLTAKAGLLLGGGTLVGLGARWAGGCPSGHSIVGIAQGAMSSVIATIGFMVGGVVLFNLLVSILGG